MTANKYGDYELLAKLIYPSIEASGNVYYGQTRKLTTDNTFGRNELNFDSHIETFSSGSSYQSYFNWRVGPLSGAVRIEPLDKDSNNNPVDFTTLNFPNSDVYEVSLDGYTEKITDQNYALHGVMFAKYKLIFSNKKVDNNLYSGNFSTYENNISCEYENIIVRNYKYMDGYDPYTRSFYVEKEGIDWYLYIQVAFDSVYSYTRHDLTIPFTIKSIGGNSIVELTSQDNYEYSVNGLHWDDVNSSIQIKDGESIKIRIKQGPGVQSLRVGIYAEGVNVQSVTEIYGNINSLKFSDYDTNDHTDISQYSEIFKELFMSDSNNTSNIETATNLFLPATTLSEFCYSYMFSGCTLLINVPKLPATTLAEGCYSGMFYECTSLINVPKLQATTLAEGCYGVMFNGCTSLINAPKLPAITLANYCYNHMFGRCSMLSSVAVAATWGDYDRYTEGWLSNAGSQSASIKTIWCDKTHLYPENDSGIPEGWVQESYDEYPNDILDVTYKGFCDKLAINRFNNKLPFMVSSGSDSDFNGRGKLNDSTKFKMETSFDENNTHQMDTYNNDGSYNQEIWGYKSFNSPVKFRNGIYGDGFSFVSCDPDIWYGEYNYTQKLGYELGIGIEHEGCTSTSAIKSLNKVSYGYAISVTDIRSSTFTSKFSTSASINIKSHIANSNKTDEISMCVGGASLVKLTSTTNNNVDIYNISVNADSITPNNQNISIGDDSNYFSDIYVNNLHGIIPHCSNINNKYTGIPVGSICLARINSLSAENYSSSTGMKKTPFTFKVVDVGDTGIATINIRCMKDSADLNLPLLKYKVSNNEWESLVFTGTSGQALFNAVISDLHIGDTVSFKLKTASNGAYRIFFAKSDIVDSNKDSVGMFDVYGNISSLYNVEDNDGDFEDTNTNCDNMFSDFDFIRDASMLLIGVDRVHGCYQMFKECYKLVYPPVEVWCAREGCCEEMFKNCTGIKYVPRMAISGELTANRTANSIFKNMCDGCTSIKYAYVPFIKDYCDNYVSGMFTGCINIITVTILNTDNDFQSLTNSQLISLGYDSFMNNTNNTYIIESTYTNSNLTRSSYRYTLQPTVQTKRIGDTVRLDYTDTSITILTSVSIEGSNSSNCIVKNGITNLISSDTFILLTDIMSYDDYIAGAGSQDLYFSNKVALVIKVN